MSTDIQYGLLGPVEARYGGRLLPMAAGHARTVLAILLLRHGRIVPTDFIIERVWGETPPKSARTIVQSYVSRLRKALEFGGESPLLTQPPGYVLDVDAGQIDLHRFQGLVERGRIARDQGRLGDASAALRASLNLWRGPAMHDVESEALQHYETPRLEESRLDALEDCFDVELALGRHREILGDLRSVANGQRERLYGQLMIALYRSGRQIEALRTFRRIRLRLVNELGLEPGAELQALHQAMLRGDAALDWSAPPESAQVTLTETVPAPMHLPAVHRDFVGRLQATARIAAVLGSRESPDWAPTAAVSGPPGVGKTALVLHAARQLRDRFPDGQHYVDLRGASGQPLTTTAALDQLLRSLGVPAGAEDRLRAYQDCLRGRRTLLVLDDAASEAQVRPLLPIYPGCGVVVAGRTPLTGLVEAVPVPVPPLTGEEAHALLRQLIGPARADTDPAAADEIVTRCEGRPIAVRIAGRRLQERSHWPLRLFADRLAEDPIAELATGDLSVRWTLSQTYAALSGRQQRCFRTIALLTEVDLDPDEIAELLGESTSRTADDLEHLTEARLVEVSVDGAAVRYRLTGLARQFAVEQRADQDFTTAG